MSLWDDISSTDTDLPLWGLGGGLLLLILLAAAYFNHHDAMQNGFNATVVSIGTCREDLCLLQLKLENGDTVERQTGSKAFVGDVLKCGPHNCYKD